MKGYQLSGQGKLQCFSGEKKFFNDKVYLDKNAITEEVIEAFKDVCCDGGGLYDLNRDTFVVTINELNVME